MISGVGETYVYCAVCRSDVGIGHSGIRDIAKHVNTSKGPSIYDVHTERGGESSSMWTSTQKIKIKSPLMSYCLLLMQRSWCLFYPNFVFGQKKSGNFSAI